MVKQHPETETMTASQVRQQFASTINRIAKDETRVIVEKNGVPVAVMLPISDLRRLERIDEQFHNDWAIVEAFRRPFRDVPADEIERETAKAIAEAREEIMAERVRALAGTEG